MIYRCSRSRGGALPSAPSEGTPRPAKPACSLFFRLSFCSFIQPMTVTCWGGGALCWVLGPLH